MKPLHRAPSLQRVLADVAAGRPVAAAEYERLVALCRQADEKAGIDIETVREAQGAAETLHTCGRCRLVTRHVYCPQCGSRL